MTMTAEARDDDDEDRRAQSVIVEAPPGRAPCFWQFAGATA
jgi:hypothetical protein